jgi:hypothetical protein
MPAGSARSRNTVAQDCGRFGTLAIFVAIRRASSPHLAPQIKDPAVIDQAPKLKETLVSDRRTFQSIMTSAEVDAALTKPPCPKTWRWRLFEWLERG